MTKIVHYIGLDVHKETIAVFIAPQNSTFALRSPKQAPQRGAVYQPRVRPKAATLGPGPHKTPSPSSAPRRGGGGTQGGGGTSDQRRGAPTPRHSHPA